MFEQPRSESRPGRVPWILRNVPAPRTWPSSSPSSSPSNLALEPGSSNLALEPRTLDPRTWTSNLDLEPGPRAAPRTWRSNLALETWALEPGPRTWPSNLALEPGPRTWPSNLALEPGARTWRSNLALEPWILALEPCAMVKISGSWRKFPTAAEKKAQLIFRIRVDLVYLDVQGPAGIVSISND